MKKKKKMTMQGKRTIKHMESKNWPQFYKKTHASNKKRSRRLTPALENLSKETKGKCFKQTTS